ncbi:putative E3 ubiquitin-protein ligase HTD2 [Terramyces sp. JEL0728]|nr:putative E3 ubiquitin-protein ligase HTD2 [Terramyces sp. JEL0728]
MSNTLGADDTNAANQAALDLKKLQLHGDMKGNYKAKIKDLMQSNGQENVKVLLYDIFSNTKNIIAAFAQFDNTLDSYVIHLGEFLKWFQEIVTFENELAIMNGVNTLLDHIQNGVQEIGKDDYLCFVIVMILPILQDPDTSMTVLPKLCQLLAKFNQTDKFGFAFILQESIQHSGNTSIEKSQFFKQIIQLFQQYLTIQILNSEAGTDPDEKVPNINLAAINETNNFIPYYELYNETVEESLDLKEDYPKWKVHDGFSFCNYSFLLSTATKGDILRIESMIQMRHELQDSFFRAMFIGVNNPYLQLELRRTNIIRDTLYQLEGKTNHDLKKQLRVSFLGEDGIDEGGIQKEFFQLISKEMFSSTYGMFVTNDDSRTSWFGYWDGGLDEETLAEYNLLGKLIGLAFYNGVALDINFASAVYKKLVNSSVQLADLTEWDPALGKGLNQLLDYEGDVEQDFARTFSIDMVTVLGKRVSVDLVNNGSEIMVTNANREEYVAQYLEYFFNTSVDDIFSAFQQGFNSVMNGSAITLFRAEELQELICGSPSLDFKALQESAVYDGYEADTLVIKYFWEIVQDFTDEQKKQFLVFTTGSDRVPVGGLGKLQFVIARNGTDSDRLPTSHTCFNALLLCEYSSKEKLKDRLLLALANRNCGFYLN